MALEKKGDLLNSAYLNISYSASLKRDLVLADVSISGGNTNNSMDLGISSSLGYTMGDCKLSLGIEDSIQFNFGTLTSFPMLDLKGMSKKLEKITNKHTKKSREYSKNFYVYSAKDNFITSNGKIIIEKKSKTFTSFPIVTSLTYLAGIGLGFIPESFQNFLVTNSNKAKKIVNSKSIIRQPIADGLEDTAKKIEKNVNIKANNNSLCFRRMKLGNNFYKLFIVPFGSDDATDKSNYNSLDEINKKANYLNFISECNKTDHTFYFKLGCKLVLVLDDSSSSERYISEKIDLFVLPNVELDVKKEVTIDTACEDICKQINQVKKIYFPIFVSYQNLKFERIDDTASDTKLETTIDFVLTSILNENCTQEDLKLFFDNPSSNRARLDIYVQNVLQHPTTNEDFNNCSLNLHLYDNNNSNYNVKCDYIEDSNITIDLKGKQDNTVEKRQIALNEGNFIYENNAICDIESGAFIEGDYCLIGELTENNGYIQLSDIYSADFCFYQESSKFLLDLLDKTSGKHLDEKNHIINLTGKIYSQKKQTVEDTKSTTNNDCFIKIEKINEQEKKYRLITYLLDKGITEENFTSFKKESFCNVIEFNSLREINNKLIMLYEKSNDLQAKTITIYSYRISFSPDKTLYSNNQLFFYIKDEPINFKYTQNVDFFLDLNKYPSLLMLGIFGIFMYFQGKNLGNKQLENIRKQLNISNNVNGIFFKNEKTIFLRAGQQIKITDDISNGGAKLIIDKDKAQLCGNEINIKSKNFQLLQANKQLKISRNDYKNILLAKDNVEMKFGSNTIKISKDQVIFRNLYQELVLKKDSFCFQNLKLFN